MGEAVLTAQAAAHLVQRGGVAFRWLSVQPPLRQQGLARHVQPVQGPRLQPVDLRSARLLQQQAQRQLLLQEQEQEALHHRPPRLAMTSATMPAA